eukprot:15125879-Ditylum_brightwellii.AAC.1
MMKYINIESCHRKAVFQVIPAGVFTHLGRFTSQISENEKTPITNLYLMCIETLKRVSLLPKQIPTIRDVCHQKETQQK